MAATPTPATPAPTATTTSAVPAATVSTLPGRIPLTPAAPANTGPASINTPTINTANGADGRGARRRWYTLATACLSLLITVVDGTIVNVALPTFARALHAGTSSLQWITDAYTLTFAALLLMAGAIADRYGRHHALAAGLAVFAGGSLAAVFTGTPAELIAARAVMGVGAAFIMPATLAIITSVFTDRHERAKAIGIWSAVSGLGVAVGPVAGGWLMAHFGWHAIFAVNLPLTATALAAGRWFIPASRAAVRRRLDPAGAALSVAAFTVLTWALIEAPSHGWLSATTQSAFAGAVALIAAFTAVEARSDHPMLPLALLRQRLIAGGAIALLLLFFALAGTLFLTTQVYQFVLGYSPLAAGVRAVPSAMALAAAAPLGARLARRAGAAIPVASGLALVTGGLAFWATATGASGYPHYVIAMVAIAGGIGLAMSAATSSALEQLPPAMAGVGSAINDATRNMGSVLGVAVVGSVAASVSGIRAASVSSLSRLASGHGLAARGLAGQVTAGHGLAGPASVTTAHVIASAQAVAGAFITGADRGALVAAALTLAGALVALRLLRRT